MPTVPTILETAESLINQGLTKVVATYNDGEQRPLRLFKSSMGQICFFRQGSRKYGYTLNNVEIKAIRPVIPTKTTKAKWEDGWKKVRARLVASGLWSVVIKEIDLALSLGYEKMDQAYKDYWTIPEEAFIAKYPELTAVNDEGKTYITSSTVWNYAKLAKVKKMYFSRTGNDAVLAMIKSAMDSKKDWTANGRVSYDVSFSYNAAKQKAWYSEEFKDCGNGHYYLALDATHALFIEDD